MPHSKSAAKRLRTSLKSHGRHQSRKRKLKLTEKKYRSISASPEKKNMEETLKNIFSQIDKAVKAGSIHPNKAARKKSRLAKLAAK